MRMKINEAIDECRRYLEHADREKDKSIALQRLAADVRMGKCSALERDTRMRKIMGERPTIYDGGNLEDAIRSLLKHVNRDKL